MCILLKLDYAKFGIFNLFFQKLSKKNLWLDPPSLGKGRVNRTTGLPGGGVTSAHNKQWRAILT